MLLWFYFLVISNNQPVDVSTSSSSQIQNDAAETTNDSPRKLYSYLE